MNGAWCVLCDVWVHWMVKAYGEANEMYHLSLRFLLLMVFNSLQSTFDSEFMV